MMAEISDETLAQQLQDGRLSALAILVERYHGPLLAFLYRLTGGHKPLAEDLVQDCFLRLLRSIGGYQGTRPFKPWLYAIATNLARDHYKQADQRRTETPSDDTWVNYPSREPLPEQVAASHDTAARVQAALWGLPDHQRETIILRYYQELSLQEISQTLEIPVGTVKSRLSLGLQALKQLMPIELMEHSHE